MLQWNSSNEELCIYSQCGDRNHSGIHLYWLGVPQSLIGHVSNPKTDIPRQLEEYENKVTDYMRSSKKLWQQHLEEGGQGMTVLKLWRLGSQKEISSVSCNYLVYVENNLQCRESENFK